jgi:hypothetical protein
LIPSEEGGSAVYKMQKIMLMMKIILKEDNKTSQRGGSSIKHVD